MEKARRRIRATTFTVGVLGLGVLGAQVARTLTAFGVPVRGYSRTAKREIEGVRTFAGEAQFDAFLDGVKVLINLLPHTPDTEGMLNARTFEQARARRVSGQPGARRRIWSKTICSTPSRAARSPPRRSMYSTRSRCRDDHPFWTSRASTITPHVSAHDVARRKRRADRARRSGACARRDDIAA